MNVELAPIDLRPLIFSVIVFVISVIILWILPATLAYVETCWNIKPHRKRMYWVREVAGCCLLTLLTGSLAMSLLSFFRVAHTLSPSLFFAGLAGGLLFTLGYKIGKG